MKKMMTLLLALSAAIASTAQSPRSFPNDRYDRDVANGQTRYPGYDNNGRYNNDPRNNYTFSERERDLQIARINRDYDARAWQIQSDRRLRRHERTYQLNCLANQRRDELRRVWERYNAGRVAYQNNRNENDRRW